MSHTSRSIGAEGALIDVVVSVFPARRKKLEKLGLSVPAPVVIMAQIDTGAFCSGLDENVFEKLELRGEIDTQRILTPSTGEEPHEAPVYVVDLTLLGVEGNRTFAAHRVLAHVFGPGEEARGLIGRDILDLCHFTYDGPGKSFTLVF